MKSLRKTIKYSKVIVVALVILTSFSFATFALAQNKTDKTLSTEKGSIGSYIPNCTDTANCQDISVFMVTAIGIGRFLFGIIGALALVMFVYGGFVWITSRGSSDKVKKGMEIFGAAIIGLIISFSAYMLVSYFSERIIQVDDQYKLKQVK